MRRENWVKQRVVIKNGEGKKQRRQETGQKKRQTLGPAIRQRGRVDDIKLVLARELSPRSHWMAIAVREHMHDPRRPGR